MKNIFLIGLICIASPTQWCKPPISKLQCSEQFFDCAKVCSEICAKTVDHSYQFGKCFTKCNQPCRNEFCKAARMVKMVDTEDLKSFANIQRGGSNPSVGINL